MRPILMVPPSMRVLDLIVEMRDKHTQMAVVVDEFGGTDGLVTVEDLVSEESSASSRDEHDEPRRRNWSRTPDGTIDADGAHLARRARAGSRHPPAGRRRPTTRPTRWAA